MQNAIGASILVGLNLGSKFFEMDVIAPVEERVWGSALRPQNSNNTHNNNNTIPNNSSNKNDAQCMRNRKEPDQKDSMTTHGGSTSTGPSINWRNTEVEVIMK